MTVGVRPWLPWPFREIDWLVEPVRAERLAALRIGVGLVLAADVIGTYVPWGTDFLARGGLGGAAVFPLAGSRLLQWSALRSVESPLAWQIVLTLWIASALCLAIGFWSRAAAAVAWVLAMSIYNLNPFVVNGGDNVRATMLFVLALSPAGATWSVDRWLAARRGAADDGGPRFVWPWGLRLLFVQMAVAYCMTGLFKSAFPPWRDGTAMHWILADFGWTRWSYAALPWPELLVPLATWTVLGWELGFPILVLVPRLRRPTLVLGVAFHLGTALCFQLAAFPFYMCCLYLPLAPWERLAERATARRREGVATLPPAVADGVTRR